MSQTRRRTLSRALVSGLCTLLLPVVLLLVLFCWPYPSERLTENPLHSYRVVDRDGSLLREVVGEEGERARYTPLPEISPLLVRALVAVEDRRFFSHPGVDPVGAARALLDNTLAMRQVSGASTITMQLARLLGGLPRTPAGKLRQIIDAARIERATSKERILELYLNRASFAPGTIGVTAASERLFGAGTRNLSLSQAALLAGLAQAPSAYFPERHPERALARREEVLWAMHEMGLITEQERARASGEALTLRDGRRDPVALHFTEHVLSKRPAPGTIRTTLDRELQLAAEQMTAEHVERLKAGGLSQAAALVLDNETCDVLAMVGSADWWGSEGGRNNGTLALRQPGSTLKPFLYGLAFERGYDPADVAADIPTRYPDADGLLMHPKNYSDHFTGPVLLGEALGRSLNVPAVRLANTLGIADVLSVMQRAGLRSLDQGPEHYGLGLVLGNGEVSLLELASAYAMLARGGESCVPRVLQDDPLSPGERVLSEASAALVRSILSDEALRARAFGYDNPLMLGLPVAVKTGTSSNWRDSLAVGFTDRHTVAVWAGDFDGAPMDRLSGAIGAGPLFREILREVTLGGANASPPEAEMPEGIEEIEVCALSGAAPTPLCPHRRAVRVLEADAQRPPCAWHREIRVDIRNGLRASERCPSRYSERRVFASLPSAYAQWQHDSGAAPPAQWSPLCPEEGLTADAIVVTHPRDGDIFVIEPGYESETQSIALAAEIDPPTPEVIWRVDGERISSNGWPYDGSWVLEPGKHEIVAVAGGRESEPVHIEVR